MPLIIFRFRQLLRQFVRDERGASAIEYALIAAMVALAIVTFVTPVNEAISDIFQDIRVALEGGGGEN